MWRGCEVGVVPFQTSWLCQGPSAIGDQPSFLCEQLLVQEGLLKKQGRQLGDIERDVSELAHMTRAALPALCSQLTHIEDRLSAVLDTAQKQTEIVSEVAILRREIVQRNHAVRRALGDGVTSLRRPSESAPYAVGMSRDFAQQ